MASVGCLGLGRFVDVIVCSYLFLSPSIVWASELRPDHSASPRKPQVVMDATVELSKAQEEEESKKGMYDISEYSIIVEGSLEVKFPTIWTDGKAQPARSSAMEKVRGEKIRDETDQPWRKSEVRGSEMKKIRKDEKVGKS